MIYPKNSQCLPIVLKTFIPGGFIIDNIRVVNNEPTFKRVRIETLSKYSYDKSFVLNDDGSGEFVIAHGPLSLNCSTKDNNTTVKFDFNIKNSFLWSGFIRNKPNSLDLHVVRVGDMIDNDVLYIR